jgi:hypothetical protein
VLIRHTKVVTSVANQTDDQWKARKALDAAERNVDRHGGPGHAGKGYNRDLEEAQREASRQGVER